MKSRVQMKSTGTHVSTMHTGTRAHTHTHTRTHTRTHTHTHTHTHARKRTRTHTHRYRCLCQPNLGNCDNPFPTLSHHTNIFAIIHTCTVFWSQSFQDLTDSQTPVPCTLCALPQRQQHTPGTREC